MVSSRPCISGSVSKLFKCASMDPGVACVQPLARGRVTYIANLIAVDMDCYVSFIISPRRFRIHEYLRCGAIFLAVGVQMHTGLQVVFGDPTVLHGIGLQPFVIPHFQIYKNWAPRHSQFIVEFAEAPRASTIGGSRDLLAALDYRCIIVSAQFTILRHIRFSEI